MKLVLIILLETKKIDKVNGNNCRKSFGDSAEVCLQFARVGRGNLALHWLKYETESEACRDLTAALQEVKERGG